MESITITLADGADPDKVAKELEARGALIHQRLREIGVLLGEAPASRVDGLRALAGVADVSGEHLVYTQAQP